MLKVEGKLYYVEDVSNKLYRVQDNKGFNEEIILNIRYKNAAGEIISICREISTYIDLLSLFKSENKIEGEALVKSIWNLKVEVVIPRRGLSVCIVNFTGKMFKHNVVTAVVKIMSIVNSSRYSKPLDRMKTDDRWISTSRRKDSWNSGVHALKFATIDIIKYGIVEEEEYDYRTKVASYC